MGSAGVFQSGRLWSLWDLMIQFDVRLLVTRLSHIEGFEESLLGLRPFGMQLSESNLPDRRLTEDGRKWLWAYLGPFQEELKPLDLRVASIEVQYIWNHAHEWSAKEIAVALKGLRWKIEQELRDRVFLYLDPKEAGLFAAEFPFGESVGTAFPSATFDVREAAQSYAVGRHTACVFFCMRSLEHGLRALAVDVGRTFDRQQWHNVIEEIESEVRSIAKTGPKTPEKDERVKWLSEAAKEFFYFKDGWRNYVTHGRSRYDGPQALSMLEHVRAFMTHLASRLGEVPPSAAQSS
jgi:hypothetical protein